MGKSILKIWQFNIEIWKDDKKNCHVNMIIWKMVAEICHHALYLKLNISLT